MNEPAPPPLIDKRLGVILVIAAIAALVPFVFNPGTGAGKVAWGSSFETATATSKETGRPLLIYFTATWCGPCQDMKAHVFTEDAVANTLNNRFVPVMIETTDDTDEVRELGGRYAVKYLPTMVITDAEGNVIAERYGGIGADDFLEWLTPHGKRDATNTQS